MYLLYQLLSNKLLYVGRPDDSALPASDLQEIKNGTDELDANKTLVGTVKGVLNPNLSHYTYQSDQEDTFKSKKHVGLQSNTALAIVSPIKQWAFGSNNILPNVTTTGTSIWSNIKGNKSASNTNKTNLTTVQYAVATANLLTSINNSITSLTSTQNSNIANTY